MNKINELTLAHLIFPKDHDGSPESSGFQLPPAVAGFFLGSSFADFFTVILAGLAFADFFTGLLAGSVLTFADFFTGLGRFSTLIEPLLQSVIELNIASKSGSRPWWNASIPSGISDFITGFLTGSVFADFFTELVAWPWSSESDSSLERLVGGLNEKSCLGILKNLRRKFRGTKLFQKKL